MGIHLDSCVRRLLLTLRGRNHLRDFSFSLSRTKTLPATIVEDLQKTLTDMGANAASLKDTDQDC